MCVDDSLSNRNRLKLRNEEWVDVKRRYLYLDLSGGSFSPSAAETKLGLTLHEKVEPGAPRMYYRNKRNPNYGTPSPVGRAVFQAPGAIAENEEWKWMMETIRRFAGRLRRLGAKEIVFWHLAFFPPDAQENFELNIGDLGTLSRAKVTYCLSVYNLPWKKIAKMPPRFAQTLVI